MYDLAIYCGNINMSNIAVAVLLGAQVCNRRCHDYICRHTKAVTRLEYCYSYWITAAVYNGY